MITEGHDIKLYTKAINNCTGGAMDRDTDWGIGESIRIRILIEFIIFTYLGNLSLPTAMDK